MHIHYEELSDVARYIETHSNATLEQQTPTLENILNNIKKFKPLNGSSKILEIGVGTGWFQIYCKQQALNISGLEISPQLIDVAKEFAKRYCVELDLSVGNIEETDIGVSAYEVIVASSVFEHVEDWKGGIEKVFQALKPGGVFYFDSTNKFSFVSGEYKSFPLYGWMPNSWRYRVRKARQGEDIMKLGIDFHQFTYPQLRRFFSDVGFSKVLDVVDFKDTRGIKNSKRLAYNSLKKSKPLKHVALTFVPATIFICVK